MSWLRRKSTSDNEPSGDPTIEYARRVIQNPRGNRSRRGSDQDRLDSATPPPNGTDSDFCYGEEINPCA